MGMSGSGALNYGKERKVILSHFIMYSCIVHRSLQRLQKPLFSKVLQNKGCLPFVWHRVELYIMCLPPKGVIPLLHLSQTWWSLQLQNQLAALVQSTSWKRFFFVSASWILQLLFQRVQIWHGANKIAFQLFLTSSYLLESELPATEVSRWFRNHLQGFRNYLKGWRKCTRTDTFHTVFT